MPQKRTLKEKIRIPLTILMLELSRLFSYRCSGITSFGIIKICLGLPLPVIHPAKHTILHPQSTNIPVLTNLSRIVTILFFVTELIFSRRVHILRTKSPAHVFPQPMFKQHRWIRHPERSRFKSNLRVIFLPVCKSRCTACHVNRPSRAKIFGRLEYGTPLPVIQRNRLHVIQRKTSQIHGPVLCVSQLDTIIKHPHVFGPHRPDIHGLQAPDSPVILDLHPRKIT